MGWGCSYFKPASPECRLAIIARCRLNALFLPWLRVVHFGRRRGPRLWPLTCFRMVSRPGVTSTQNIRVTDGVFIVPNGDANVKRRD